MSVRIAINGFGRIGRNVLRAIHESVCVAVEASAPFGWERYVGERGTVIGMTNFGASAPAKDLFAHFGITAEAVVAAVNERLRRRC